MCKILIVAGLLFACLILACDSKPTVPESERLVGIWLWIKDVGGQTRTETPLTCGCSREFVFNVGGKYEFYYNNELTESGDYLITREYDYMQKKEVTMLHLKNGATQIEFDNSELYIYPDPGCLSCPDTIFYGRAFCGNN